jgi:integrase
MLRGVLAMKKATLVKIDAPYIQARGATYRYRRIVPHALRERLGRDEWVKSLKTADPIKAQQAAAKLAALHDVLIARLEGNSDIADDKLIAAAEAEAEALLKAGPAAVEEALLMFVNEAHSRWIDELSQKREPAPLDLTAYQHAVIRAADNGGQHVPQVVTISEAYARDLKLYGATRRDERPFEIAVKHFKHYAGDIDIRTIKREDVLKWIAGCRNRKPKLGDATIRRRMEALSAIQSRYLRDHNLPRTLVWSGHGLQGASATDRLAWHSTHLEAIDAYIASGRSAPVVGRLFHLMKCTGMGPSEAGGLLVSDVHLESTITDAEGREVACVPHVWVRPNQLRKLKNKHRERVLPLVGDALTAVKAALKEAEEAKRTGLFFNEFDRNTVSNRLGLALRSAGISKSKRLTSYSYRHSFIDILKRSGMREDLRLYLEGHAGTKVTHRYGAPIPELHEARDALEKALPLLGRVNPSIFAGDELVIDDGKAAKERRKSARVRGRAR